LEQTTTLLLQFHWIAYHNLEISTASKQWSCWYQLLQRLTTLKGQPDKMVLDKMEQTKW